MTHQQIDEAVFTMNAQGHSFRVSVRQETQRTWAWRAVAADGWKIVSGVADAETLEDAVERAKQDVIYLARESKVRGG